MAELDIAPGLQQFMYIHGRMPTLDEIKSIEIMTISLPMIVPIEDYIKYWLDMNEGGQP